jgi:4-carboxymuconolactone decarboxylase
MTEQTHDERTQRGLEWFEYITTKPLALSESPYVNAGVRDFVMAEVWSRPGLDVRSRRFIALSCAVAAGHPVPIQSHIYSALRSGHISLEEMREFALQVAVYAGWARASTLDMVIAETWAKIEAEGGPINRARPGDPA